MIAEIHYRIDRRARGHHPGHHRSQQRGSGQEFVGHAPLTVARDPRRLDLRVSLRDPFEQFWVRSFRQRSQVLVYLLADLSASMSFAGERRKQDVIADLVDSLAYSANRTGDRFACIGFDRKVRLDYALMPTHAFAAAHALALRLRSAEAHGVGSEGLLEAIALLPRQRALVFLVSDFHFPMTFAAEALARLAPHQLVPLVLWDRAEYARLPRFGLVSVRDAESGQRRLVFLRERLRERIERSYAQRRAEIEALCFSHRAPALFLEDGFDAQRLSRHFLDRELALAGAAA